MRAVKSVLSRVGMMVAWKDCWSVASWDVVMVEMSAVRWAVSAQLLAGLMDIKTADSWDANLVYEKVDQSVD